MNFRLKNLKSLRNHRGIDQAVLSFDLNADLRPAFHWNLKQLFVYVVAEYETSANPLNQVIIWDKIVKSQKGKFLVMLLGSSHLHNLILFSHDHTSFIPTILLRSIEAMLKISDEFVKYALIDQGAELRGKKITLKLMWDHMPLTGRLYVHQDGNKTFTLPEEYTNSK